jgi:hypothetical protein
VVSSHEIGGAKEVSVLLLDWVKADRTLDVCRGQCQKATSHQHSARRKNPPFEVAKSKSPGEMPGLNFV